MNLMTSGSLKAPEKPDEFVFNMFEGFKYPYVKTDTVDFKIQLWIDHILNVVCKGNAMHAKTLTQWMAHIIQKPTQKAYAVIIYGAGKSILYDMFTRCIGKDLGLQVSRLEDLTQTHNTHHRHMVSIVGGM